MEKYTELKWYQKPIFVIILLVVFLPVGLYLMWKYGLWSKQIRWIVTGSIIFIYGIIKISNGINQTKISNGINQTPNKSNSESKVLTQSDVLGTWRAKGNGIKSTYIFNGDGTYQFTSVILGDFGSDEGTWEIYGSTIDMQTLNGIRNSASFASDYQSFRANNMTYTR